MKNNKFLAAALALPLIFLLLWLIFLQVKASGPTVVVAMRGYDPRDLLSGHYLRLQPDWEKTDCTQFSDQICPREAFADHYRYYLPETAAPILEKQQDEGQADFAIRFYYKVGEEPFIKELLLNGQPWQRQFKQ